jgi:hypothetical protein
VPPHLGGAIGAVVLELLDQLQSRAAA